MHWRWLLPFPVAAFLCGEAVQAPRLVAPLARTSETCATYAAARERYLFAYANAWSQPAASRELLGEMEGLLQGCVGPETAALRVRAEALRRRQSL